MGQTTGQKTTANGLATRAQLLKKTARRYAYFPESGTIDGLRFRMQSWTERERSDFESKMLSAKGTVSKAKMEDSRRRLIALTLVDESGERLLSDDDVSALEGIDSRLTSALFTAASDHIGFASDDLEELVKNSGEIRADDSPSC